MRSRAPVNASFCMKHLIGCGVHCASTQARSLSLTLNMAAGRGGMTEAPPRSGITALAELDKKRIGVGPRAGTGGTYVPAILKVLGISAEISYGSFNPVATELLAGRVDAVLTLIG